jgi:beta-galactosidase/beta-glucuronidase
VNVETDFNLTSDHLDYPRKQFRRKNWQSLNGEWKFEYDDDRKARVPADIRQWTKKIQVPFAPESKKSGIDDQGFHAICWYEREFEISRGEGRIILHFGAVDYRASVWVNDRYVGCHEGGHTPFKFDITNSLNENGPQKVSVRAEDDPHDLAKPRGKQDWQKDPHSIWYPRTSGIWQTVWLEEVPLTFLENVRWSPLLERWEVGCEAFIGGDRNKDLKLRVVLKVGKQLLADDTYKVIVGEVLRRIALSDPGIDDYRNELLWSPEKPTLIDATVQLLEDGKVIDEIQSYTALRRVTIQRDRFILNNRPYYLRLILDQGYWPDTLMTPPSQDAIKKDIELTKAAGFNGVRKHQKIEDPNFLYWADVMGLLVWEEMPSAYRFTHDSVERLIKEWIEVIDRDSNHPCIVTWVPFNESWGVPDLPDKEAHRSCVQALYHLTRTLDPHRPVIGNDGWESTSTDILGIHDYDHDPKRILNRYGDRVNFSETLKSSRPGGRILTLEGHPHHDLPIMLTEFGGIACSDPRSKGEPEGWGYSVGASCEDLQRRYQRLMMAINKIELFAGFCYTQLTDTFQEANGLFFADRTPKFPLDVMKHATTSTESPRGELLAPPVPPPQIDL